MENNDFKYIMQDTGTLYLGARYSYEELLGEDRVPFKYKAIISHYLFKEIDPSATLESHFYYLTAQDFSYQTYQQLKTKVKVTQPVEKKNLLGRVSHVYRDKVFSLGDFVGMNLARKKQSGLIIREILISKLGMAAFSV